MLYEPSETSIVKNSKDTQNSGSNMLNSIICHDSGLNINSITEFHKSKNTENKFNLVRSNYYNKYNLYDILLYPGPKFKNIPPKYMINENKYCFLLINEFKTYPITISGYISSKGKYNDSDNLIEDNESKYDESLGLFFCGKIINLENGKIKKECAPNEFICKYCMELNKKRYEIKNNYLININGRVAKINKGRYHCFGHFLCGNQIEDCINKFCCKACNSLNSYANYYNNNSN